MLIADLLQHEYVRLRPAVFFRLAAMLADHDSELGNQAEHLLANVFLVKQPTLFLNTFCSNHGACWLHRSPALQHRRAAWD